MDFTKFVGMSAVDVFNLLPAYVPTEKEYLVKNFTVESLTERAILDQQAHIHFE
jgi:hypothetical protein